MRQIGLLVSIIYFVLNDTWGKLWQYRKDTYENARIVLFTDQALYLTCPFIFLQIEPFRIQCVFQCMNTSCSSSSSLISHCFSARASSSRWLCGAGRLQTLLPLLELYYQTILKHQ